MKREALDTSGMLWASLAISCCGGPVCQWSNLALMGFAHRDLIVICSSVASQDPFGGADEALGKVG